MRMNSVLVLAMFGLLSSAAHAQSASAATTTQSVPAAAPERVASDTQRFTPGGAQFTVPAGWSITTTKNMVLLTPPEADTHLAIVGTQSADAKAAVAAAWAAYKPDSKRPIKLITPRPAREGWDERQVFEYETSPNERVVVEAIADRAGSSWTVVILDGSEPTVEKRGAPISLIFQGLRPKGYARESFAGRKANPLDTARIEQMKSFVQSAMQQLGVPGAAIALIDGGRESGSWASQTRWMRTRYSWPRRTRRG